MNNQMDNFLNVNPENMYPELYRQVKPFLDDAVSRFQSGEYDESMLESIIEDILTRSGLSQYMIEEEDEEVIPAQRMMPFGGRRQNWRNPPRRRRRPPRPWYPVTPYPIAPYYPCPGCTWNTGVITPQNLVRVMLMRQLFGL